jgi:hypothetical protein
MQLDLEMLLRKLSDGLLRDKRYESHALYVGLDMYIRTDVKNYNQRNVRIGIHFLRYGYNVLGAIDDNWLNPSFDVEKDWKLISQHDSCWVDSFNHWVNDIPRDIMTNRYGSEYKSFMDKDLTFGGSFGEWDMQVFPSFALIEKEELAGLEYQKRESNFKSKLI